MNWDKKKLADFNAIQIISNKTENDKILASKSNLSLFHEYQSENPLHLFFNCEYHSLDIKYIQDI